MDYPGFITTNFGWLAEETESPVDNILALFCAIAALGLFVCGVRSKDDYKGGDMLVFSIFPCAILLVPDLPDETSALAALSIILIVASIWATNDATSKFFAVLTTVSLGIMIGLQAIKLFS